MYGTYLRKCLLERGLDVQMLSPVHVDEDSRDLSICSPDEDSWNYFYDYTEFHSYTGTDGEMTYVADLGRADIRDRSFDIFEETAGYRPDNLWGIQNMIRYDVIEDRLKNSGYFVEEFDEDGNVVSCEVTEIGKLMGFSVDDDAPGEIILNTFAQQYVLAGIICGELANI